MPTLQILNTGETISTIFNWTYRYGYYKLSLFDAAIDIIIGKYADVSRPIPNNPKPKWVGMWEITIGMKYLSRDREKFFLKPEDAIAAAERVVIKMAEKILERSREQVKV